MALSTAVRIARFQPIVLTNATISAAIVIIIMAMVATAMYNAI